MTLIVRSCHSQESIFLTTYVQVGIAKVLASEIALLASNKLFEFAGTGSTRESLNLHRHWRNARSNTATGKQSGKIPGRRTRPG